MKRVIVSGGFDDLRFRDFRFLDEAAKLGDVHALLTSDEAVESMTGKPPKFPQAERQYFLQAIRYVDKITLLDGAARMDGLTLPSGEKPHIWAVPEYEDTPGKRSFAKSEGINYCVINSDVLKQSPPLPTAAMNPNSSRKKVVVTGCYDWFHSGHVRFCEECSEIGDLYVVVGHDENIRLLKGEGHPLFPATERRFIVGSIRYVTQALISTGMGWLDAEPEIARIKPDIYAVNEDGDKPEKTRLLRKEWH